MISAINNNSSPTFTSVIPVRVFIDGMETFDSKNIKTACRQLSSILVGPAKDDAQKLNIISKFAQVVPDYDFNMGYRGFPKSKNGKTTVPSDYFRSISELGGSFLFTGEQAKKLKELGKVLGIEEFTCKLHDITESFDLYTARQNYARTLRKILSAMHLRVRENYDSYTKLPQGTPVELNINLNSNGKYGLKSFKMQIDNITFSKKSS